jgi:hypothetical protein
VWITGTDEAELKRRLPGLAKALRKVPVLGLSGPAVAFAGDAGIGAVPDAVVEAAGPTEVLRAALKRVPGAVGYSVGPASALAVRGRQIKRLGGDRLTITLAEGPGGAPVHGAG